MKGNGSEFRKEINELTVRVKRIENYLWPLGGPSSPTEFAERLKKVEVQLDNLRQTTIAKEIQAKKRFDKLVEIVSKLQRLVKGLRGRGREMIARG